MDRVISLDESGNFIRKSGVSHISGYIVDVNSAEEEGIAIENLLKEICDEFNEQVLRKNNRKYYVIYPNSLHCGDKDTFYVRNNPLGSAKSPNDWTLYGGDNKEQATDNKIFQSFLIERVIAYMGKHGYQIYSFIDPFLQEGYDEAENMQSNLMNLGKGANLYERMAILSVYNNVFYSLGDKAERYVFELATRVLPRTGGTWEELYEIYTNASGKKWSTITNTSTYKTALATMLYEQDSKDVYRDSEYIFHVSSINYSKENGETTPYHYLADVVCTHVRNLIDAKFGTKKDTKENKITCEGLLQLAQEQGIQIRIYDVCDTYFRAMVESVKKAEIVDYYGKCYDLEQSSAKYKLFYSQYWMPKLEEYFQFCLSTSEKYRKCFEGKIPEFITALNGYMGIREEAYEKGLYIAQKIASLVEKQYIYQCRGRALFEIYDIILRGYNHRGATDETRACIEKCEIYKGHIEVEAYIAHTLRVLEFYFNSFDYEAALQAGLELDTAVSQMKDIYRTCYRTSSEISEEIVDSINEAENYRFKLAGKLWSNMGQACGFLEKYSLGQRYFSKALREFDRNSADYYITMSHYLHLLIAGNKKEQYETYAEIYFGEKNLWKQMEFVLSKGNAFMLLVFVKAFHVFYVKDKSNLNLLKEVVSDISSRPIGNEHPWELIYKNLYECMLRQKENFNAEELRKVREYALTCVPNADATIRMIQINAKITFLQKEDAGCAEYFAIECLDEEEIKLCSRFFGNVAEMTFEELKAFMDEKVVYAYR